MFLSCLDLQGRGVMKDLYLRLIYGIYGIEIVDRRIAQIVYGHLDVILH